MSEHPAKSPVASEIAGFNKEELKHTETAEKNPLPSMDGNYLCTSRLPL